MTIVIPFAIVMGTIFGLIGRVFTPSATRISVWSAILWGSVGSLIGTILVSGFVYGGSSSVVVIVLIAQFVFAVAAVMLRSAIGREKRTTRRSQAVVQAPGPPPPSSPAQAARVEPPPWRSEPPTARIFLCYRRSDSSHAAGRLADRLRQRYGHDSIFMDVDSIATGQNYRTRAAAAIQNSSVVLVLIGHRWADERAAHGRRLDNPGDNVRQEVEFALRLGRVLPVLVDGASMPYPQNLPRSLAPLADLNAAPLRHLSWDDDAERLIGALDRRRGS